MNKTTSVLFAVLLLALAGITFWFLQRLQTLEIQLEAISSSSEPALHLMMGNMQSYLQKLSYAVDYESGELAHFYLHELEELSEDIIRHIPEYDGHPVGELMSVMFLPVVEETEEALDNKDWQLVRDRHSVMVQACNNCHTATDHGYIRITAKADQNPFNQDFSSP